MIKLLSGSIMCIFLLITSLAHSADYPDHPVNILTMTKPGAQIDAPSAASRAILRTGSIFWPMLRCILSPGRTKILPLWVAWPSKTEACLSNLPGTSISMSCSPSASFRCWRSPWRSFWWPAALPRDFWSLPSQSNTRTTRDAGSL